MTGEPQTTDDVPLKRKIILTATNASRAVGTTLLAIFFDIARTAPDEAFTTWGISPAFGRDWLWWLMWAHWASAAAAGLIFTMCLIGWLTDAIEALTDRRRCHA